MQHEFYKYIFLTKTISLALKCEWGDGALAVDGCFLVICSPVVLCCVAAASIKSIFFLHFSLFTKGKCNHIRLLPSENGRDIESVFRVLCTSPSFRDKDTSVFTWQTHFWKEGTGMPLSHTKDYMKIDNPLGAHL